MAEKTLKTRVINKHELAEDWDKAEGFIPYKGEIVVYDSPNETEPSKIKIGTGNTAIKYLPFIKGVGKETPDSGEIFNLYGPIYEDFIEDDTVVTYKFENVSVGPYTTASGKGTQAGNKAFKIINIENIKPYEDIELGDSGLKAVTAVFWEDINNEVLCKFTRIESPGAPELYFDDGTNNGRFIAIDQSYHNDDINIIASAMAELGLIIDDYYLITLGDADDSGGREVLSIKHKVSDIETWNITLRGNVLETATPYEIGDIVQIECKGTFIDVLQIESIETDIINEETVSILKISPIDPSHLYGKNDLILQAEDPNNVKNWLYVVGKNDNAESNPQSIGAFATGYNTVATGRGAFVGGESNKALGRYSAAVGRQNIVGYAGFASGRWNTVLSQHGFASGDSNTVLGSTSGATLGCQNTVLASYATAIGRENQIGSVAAYSLVTGYGNKSQSEAQLITGKFSQTSKDDLFVIGNGTSDSNRNNAFVLDKNGNLKIQGTIYTNNSEVITKKNNIGQLTEKGGVILNNTAGNSTCAAIGLGAFAVGNNSQANNRSAIAMGERAVAKYIATMAVGVDTLAAGYATVALGYGTQTATGGTNIIGGQTAIGRYNKIASNAMFVVGNGYQNENGEWVRQNAFEVKNDGTAWLQTQGELDNNVVIKKTLDNTKAELKSELASNELIDVLQYISLSLDGHYTGKKIYTLSTIDEWDEGDVIHYNLGFSDGTDQVIIAIYLPVTDNLADYNFILNQRYLIDTTAQENDAPIIHSMYLIKQISDKQDKIRIETTLPEVDTVPEGTICFVINE